MARADRLLTLFDRDPPDQPAPSLAADLDVSDIRLKEDVTEVARLASGLGLYRFRYASDQTTHVGVIAQEVEGLVPEAVTRGNDGYLRVDYGRLGLRMMTWQEWIAQDESNDQPQ